MNNVISTVLTKIGQHQIIRPSESILIRPGDINYGVVFVTEGMVSLMTADSTTGKPVTLIKRFKKGQLILIELIREQCYDKSFVLTSGNYATRIVKAKSNAFLDQVSDGSSTILSVLRSSVECISVMANKLSKRTEFSHADFYAVALMQRMQEEGVTPLDGDPHVDVFITRKNLAAITGFGERTMGRAHQELIEKGVIMKNQSRVRITINHEILAGVIKGKSLARLAL